MKTKHNVHLEDLLIMKLSVLYDMENNLIKALPKLARASSDPELAQGFTEHLKETEMQAQRLEKALEILEAKPKRTKGAGIRGIIEDGEWIIKHVEPPTARDVNLVRAGQYAEHYEIAGYNGAIAWAHQLGEAEVVSLLEANLKEEIAADEKLTAAGKKLDPQLA